MLFHSISCLDVSSTSSFQLILYIIPATWLWCSYVIPACISTSICYVLDFLWHHLSTHTWLLYTLASSATFQISLFQSLLGRLSSIHSFFLPWGKSHTGLFLSVMVSPLSPSPHRVFAVWDIQDIHLEVQLTSSEFWMPCSTCSKIIPSLNVSVASEQQITHSLIRILMTAERTQ